MRSRSSRAIPGPESVTRAIKCEIETLIVRQLKQAKGDQVLLKVLPIASRLAMRLPSS